MTHTHTPNWFFLLISYCIQFVHMIFLFRKSTLEIRQQVYRCCVFKHARPFHHLHHTAARQERVTAAHADHCVTGATRWLRVGFSTCHVRGDPLEITRHRYLHATLSLPTHCLALRRRRNAALVGIRSFSAYVLKQLLSLAVEIFFQRHLRLVLFQSTKKPTPAASTSPPKTLNNNKIV